MLYHGEMFPQDLNMSNQSFDEPFAPLLNSGVIKTGAPVWTGHEGAVAMTAGSAPVGVGSPYPTSVGESELSTFVGEVGGQLWRTVEPM